MRGTLHAFSKASSTLLTALLWLLLAFACSVGHVGAAQVQAAKSREPKVERGMPGTHLPRSPALEALKCTVHVRHAWSPIACTRRACPTLQQAKMCPQGFQVSCAVPCCAVPTQTYLFPILRFGPNNQVSCAPHCVPLPQH